jgi:hypothetical protein
MTETDDQLARRLLRDVLDGELKWTPDMRLRIATAAHAYASLAILAELRRHNDRGDAFTTELLGLLDRITEDPQPGPDGSLRSGQPAAASGCRVCGNTDTADGEECLFAALTTVQWRAHRQHYFEQALSHEFEPAAERYADDRMELDFGAAVDAAPSQQEGEDG